jgi:leader peptidase (prepilin peptidase) / N-methyltransferase
MPLAALYIITLIAILLIDIRDRRILNILALPVTLLALAASLVNGSEQFAAALSGALIGFLFFYSLYRVGHHFYGPNALGFGDVKLAVMLGAILGIQLVLLVLSFGMLLAGLSAAVLLLLKKGNKQSSLPYGAFLAAAGIIALVWTNI